MKAKSIPLRSTILRRSLGAFALFASLALPTLSAPQALAGGSSSPVGTWKTIDDSTGQAKALVKVTENNGKLQGRVLKILKKKVENPICHQCSGARKDKPIEGMVILWGLEPDGDREWDDGHILDPDKGKIYDCQAELSASGDKLSVRGYIGLSALGRTQVWHRAK